MNRSAKLVITLVLTAGLLLAVTAGLAVTALEQVETIARIFQSGAEESCADGLLMPVAVVRVLGSTRCRP